MSGRWRERLLRLSCPSAPFAERVCGAARVAEEEGSGPGAGGLREVLSCEGGYAAVPSPLFRGARPVHGV